MTKKMKIHDVLAQHIFPNELWLMNAYQN